MNKLIILVIFTCLIFYSCEQSGVSKGRTAYKEYFDKTLKDPSSLVVHSEEIIAQDESSATFVLDIGAKNSFGGMVRQMYTIRTIGKGILDVNKYDIRELPKPNTTDGKNILYTYKAKMKPIAGFNPDDYKGKNIELQDSCIYSYLSWELKNAVNASRKRDFNKVEKLGGILPQHSTVRIKSHNEDYFTIESDEHSGIELYIEESAIF